MFTGMVKLESKSSVSENLQSKCGRCAVIVEGGSVITAEVGVFCQRGFRKADCMRTEMSRQLDIFGRDPCLLHNSGAQASCPYAGCTSEENTDTLVRNQGQHEEDFVEEGPSLSHQNTSSSLWCGDHQLEPMCHLISPSVIEYSDAIPFSDSFNSSFSFIQQSLDSEHSFWDQCAHETSKLVEPVSNKSKTQSTVVDKSLIMNASVEPSQFASVPAGISGSDILSVDQLPFTAGVFGQSEKSHKHLLDDQMLGVQLDISFSMTSNSRDNMADTGSLDTEVTSSVSVDFSDSASASSVTSGYESATSFSDQKWNVLMKKYEGVLQHCLQQNRTNSKIESMMLKLQRLQQKAVLDDDYDTAERFGKKLEELRKEQVSLKPSLPSRHPKVACFLERLRRTVHNALRRTDLECRQKEDSTEYHMLLVSTQGPEQTREQLLQEKEQIQREIVMLQNRLEELHNRSLALEEQLTQEELRLETEEVEGLVLRGGSSAQLRLIGQALDDLITSKHRVQISLSPLPCITKLQEQEQALSLYIKEATAKVVMGQRLSGSLRRKVSESETQLLALHEAKLAAISGSDFTSAKELKAEMRSVYGERDRLEGLVKRLQTLSAGSAQDLAHMKEQHSQLKKELQKKEAQYEQNLKENTVKYIELLEDILHSCGSPALERVWEADLEACHLLLRGLQLRAPSCSETEDLPLTPEPCPQVQHFSKAEADCAMLTALGGCWGPEASLQHSEFTKKLEEFLFCLEESHPENLQSDEVELTEQCEVISARLQSLEEQLQTAMQNSDQDLTVSLENEVQEVKATLQEMLSQLKESDCGDEEVEQENEEHFHDLDDGEKLEEEEDHYFSDSWEI